MSKATLRVAAAIGVLGVLTVMLRAQVSLFAPHPSPKAAWEGSVNQRIATIERLFREWKRLDALVRKGRLEETREEEEFWKALLESADDMTGDELHAALGNVPVTARVKLSKVTWEIRTGVFVLWELTGACEFRDIPRHRHVEEALKITKRYRKFLSDRADTPLPQIYLEGLQRNVELLPTDYCQAAFDVIQSKVFFKNGAISSGRWHGYLPMRAASRALIHREMKKWLKANKSSLLWSHERGWFARKGNGAAFELPTIVVATLTEAPEIVGTRPSTRRATTAPCMVW